ncbi:MAG: protein kinase, partial [Anaerolineae bacterium]
MTDPGALIGQQIDQYRIERHIARGGMADVYLARDVELQRHVALKLMLDSLAQDPNLLGRFEREAKAAAGLNHPNVIQIYSAGFSRTGQPYLAMQYVRGGSLQQKLQELAAAGQRMATNEALNLARQVASALDAIHQAGIVHRDLKPSNILLRPNGTPIVSDLGIAAVRSAATRLTRTGLVLGTPNYMSPEQGLGKPVDGRADLYALGIILYEMLAGQVPFAADSLHELRPDLSPATYTVVANCLQKAPEDRYATAADLATALDAAIAYEAGGSDHLPPPPQPTTAPSSGKRPYWLYGLIIFLLLLLGGGAIWRLRLAGPEPTATAVPLAQFVTSQPTSTATAVLTPTLAPTATNTPTPTATNTATPTATPTATAIPSPTPTVPPLPTPAFTAPYGRIVFTCFIDGFDEICTINADGSYETRLTVNPVTDFYASISPDGRQIAFSSRREGSWLAYRMNTDGGMLQRLGPTGVGAVYAPAISPDGQRVAVAVDEGGGQQSIWISNLDGSNPFQLVTASLTEDPVWSPNGLQLAFFSIMDGGMDHFIINADGSGLHRLETDVAQIGGRSDWSPDGRWLAFYAGPRDDRDIYLAAIDGSVVYRLTDGGGNLAPSFSPDGHWIAFTSYRDGDAEIFIMRIDGSGVTQLSHQSP